MIFPIVTTLAGRAVSLLATKSALLPRVLARNTPAWSIRAFSVVERVPLEDYQDGHLITDHLEYIEDMIAKTLEIDDQMASLKLTFAEKREVIQQTAPSETIDALFLRAEAQKSAISQQLAELRQSLIRCKTFAVDAPDGTSDELEGLYVEEAQNMINDSAKNAV